ncbi:MAG: PDZ domain-containing protein [Gammaproteobacteria bacterium]|nr:PDZ domain-containing protein [Gammaproteobacteria bacterium]NIM72938.1 PDZ domain-containing protein [Gammaproteobacteria bacterium]NIN38549.1 PDZ domain-containing protein [Gammaproteobacteria bacterium]NIO24690.1 PDZ domain-containing protein [Gammaproteobacteria bacterium]NIO65293.1 PDZ domain-containing protein [Gammaproteobacteria bacterium]
MSEPSDPELESPDRPNPEDYAFDMEATLDCVVGLRSQVPADALTAGVLGTERAGHGVVIADDGLIVTIGYLVTEAESLWVTTGAGVTVPGHVVGYDQATGFGLVQALQPMGVPSMAIGSSASVQVSDQAIAAGRGGREHAIETTVIAKREFAGYWEYVLDEALFTAPAHPNWGGAALIGTDGKLLGIGSLLVQQITESGQQSGANMIVPIDLLKPILGDLRMYGRRNEPARPWLGFLVQEVSHHLVVSGVYDDCPAQAAGLQVGDVISEVDGEPVSGLASLFRRIWQVGEAGVEIPMTIVRNRDPVSVNVQSTDRDSRLKSASIH